MLLPIAAAILSQAAAPPAEETEIVVRAVREKCRVELADKLLSDREFKARAREWSNGRIVRVISPRGANYRCLARIAFKLNDYGVTRIEFLDRPERP